MKKTRKADPETLMRSGRWDDAVDALSAILAKEKTAAKAKALELLEKCAEHSTYAATPAERSSPGVAVDDGGSAVPPPTVPNVEIAVENRAARPAAEGPELERHGPPVAAAGAGLARRREAVALESMGPPDLHGLSSLGLEPRIWVRMF